MGKPQPRKAAFGPDDYNQPTEVVESVYPAYAALTSSVDDFYPETTPILVQQPGNRPSVQGRNAPLYRSPSSPAYPVLPPSPIKKYRGHPPGGSPPVYWAKQSGKQSGRFVSRLIILFFILVRLVL